MHCRPIQYNEYVYRPMGTCIHVCITKPYTIVCSTDQKYNLYVLSAFDRDMHCTHACMHVICFSACMHVICFSAYNYWVCLYHHIDRFDTSVEIS